MCLISEFQEKKGDQYASAKGFSFRIEGKEAFPVKNKQMNSCSLKKNLPVTGDFQ
jgi:hypothetical protein